VVERRRRRAGDHRAVVCRYRRPQPMRPIRPIEMHQPDLGGSSVVSRGRRCLHRASPPMPAREIVCRVYLGCGAGHRVDPRVSPRHVNSLRSRTKIGRRTGARKPSGGSAWLLGCYSCPRQVGEGNLLCWCQPPWGHRCLCDSWELALLVHQKWAMKQRRHAVIPQGDSPSSPSLPIARVPSRPRIFPVPPPDAVSIVGPIFQILARPLTPHRGEVGPD